MQDNDPKHTSRRAQEFFSEQNVNWWTPPESPDANPTENLWHELKVNAHCYKDGTSSLFTHAVQVAFDYCVA